MVMFFGFLCMEMFDHSEIHRIHPGRKTKKNTSYQNGDIFVMFLSPQGSEKPSSKALYRHFWGPKEKKTGSNSPETIWRVQVADP